MISLRHFRNHVLLLLLLTNSHYVVSNREGVEVVSGIVERSEERVGRDNIGSDTFKKGRKAVGVGTLGSQCRLWKLANH